MIVKYNKTNVLGFNGILLIPGINDVDAAIVADMQDDEVMAGKFDRGELEIVEVPGVKVKAGAPAVATMIKATEKNAVALAAQTLDLGILETWLSKEKRASVKKAIKMQVAKIRDIKYRDSDKKDEGKE